jgi:uncharacterized protein (TIGR02996 family)
VSWRIDKATSDRSTCDECHKGIAKGDHRFGRTGERAIWYHLACAPQGKPRAFKPFVARAQKLLATPATKPSKATRSASARQAATDPAATIKPTASARAGAKATLGKGLPRNPELEARLLASPDDLEIRAVFADWLQSQGSPWGELIAYVDAGKKQDARRVLRKYKDHLSGGLRGVKWRKGFIDHFGAGTGRKEKVMRRVEELCALPTALLLRELLFPAAPDDEIAARLTRCAPKRLRFLFCWLSNGVAQLEIPSLERLSLYAVSDVPCDPRGLKKLFDGTAFPNLRHLELLNLLEHDLVRALIDSKLLRQLTRLEMNQNSFDEVSGRMLLDHADAFSHLREFSAELVYAQQAEFDERFAAQKATWLEATGREEREQVEAIEAE